MKRRLATAAALALSAMCPVFGVEPVFQTTEDFVFAFDSATMPPYVVTNAAAVSLTRLSWQGVTASVDGGAAATLAAPGVSGVPLLWEPSSAGVWTLRNSVEGETTFSVRHGPYGTQGAGTASDPLKIMDSLELRDLVADGTAADGSVFTLRDGLEPGAVALPAGWCVTMREGTCRLGVSVDGMVSRWDGIGFPVDFAKEGPNRKTKRREWLPVAYSGDSWCGNAAASSTLTVTPPGGAAQSHLLNGTGARVIPLIKQGLWNLSLAMESETLQSEILVVGDALFMILK